MSQENVEVVEQALVAFQDQDADALAEISAEDLEFVSIFAAVDTGEGMFRGPMCWVSYFARMAEVWDDWHIEDFRAFDAGDDRVAAIFRLVGTGKSSGARVGHEVGLAYRIRQGKLWRVRSYSDPSEALEAAGLRE